MNQFVQQMKGQQIAFQNYGIGWPSYSPFNPHQHQNDWQRRNSLPPSAFSSLNRGQYDLQGFHNQPCKRLGDQTRTCHQLKKVQRHYRMRTTQPVYYNRNDIKGKEHFNFRGETQVSEKVFSTLGKQCTNSAAFKTTKSKLSASFNISTCSPTRSANFAPRASLPPQCSVFPSKQFMKPNMNEQQLIQQLRRYIIDPSLLQTYGYPVDSLQHEGLVEIYKCLPKHLAEETISEENQRHHRHFYGRRKCNATSVHDDLHSSPGQNSADSSPCFTGSDSSNSEEDNLITPLVAFYTPDGVHQIFSGYFNSIEKQCARCSKLFKVSADGEYLSFDSCTYHWGKLTNAYNGKCCVKMYSCCQREEFSGGCSKHSLHVWNGAVAGINGPYSNFVHTEKKSHKSPKMYAIDCEMSYTGLGLEVTKISVVGYDGALVYEHFVQPQAEIIDYNTRFSGVSKKDYLPESNNVIKTFSEVQMDLLNLFDADTVLIGHALENDLRVLRLVHNTIVDTSLIFSHSTGYPYKRSLKNLTKSFLKRDIQCDEAGHSSFEDSRACLDLMLWKIRRDSLHRK